MIKGSKHTIYWKNKQKERFKSKILRDKISNSVKTFYKNLSFKDKELLKIRNRIASSKAKEYTHHLDENHYNNLKRNILKLKDAKEHLLVHRTAYRYILEKFGINEVKKYIKWLIKKGIINGKS